MDKLSPPPPLCLVGNLAENWRRFKQQFDIYQCATGIEKKDGKVRAMTFLHVVGPDSLDVYNTFVWTEDGDKLKIDKIYEQFENYCNPRKNITYERHIFFTRNQREGEKFDAYITDLRTKAASCEFAELKDSLIRDRLVCGVRKDSVRARLLREKDLTLEKCTDICRAAEASETHLKELTEEKTVLSLRSKHFEAKSSQGQSVRPKYKSKAQKTYFCNQVPSKEYGHVDQQNHKPKNRSCQYCGNDHMKGAKFCPAYGKVCSLCKLTNHFAKMCRKKKAIHVIEKSDSDDDSNETFFIGSVSNVDKIDGNDWKVQAQINNRNINFKIDSGAQCNVLPRNICDKIGINKTKKPESKLVSYSGHEIKTIGKTDVDLFYKDKHYVIEVYIVDSKAIPVLGLPTCLEIGLIQRVYSTNKSTPETTDQIIKKHKHLFSGIGCLPGEHKIQIDESIPAVVQPPRRIPHVLREEVRSELDRMERMNIITKVDQPTKWVNAIVVVRKPNGSVRICLDPRNLNKAILREHYPLKTIEDVAASLGSAKIFTKLDATSGFYQIKLDEDSTWLTTFNTPFGRYKFERLPFGIKPASEIFQRAISQIYENIDGCEVIIDDILVWGEDEHEHNERLDKVLQRTDSVNLKLNREKCKIGKNEVDYVGHIFSKEGLRPCDDKIQCIKNMPVPEDRKSLQRFLGMINYLSKFIPNMSTVNKPLRELLEKTVEWHWNEQHQSAFDKLLKALSEAPVLKFYEVNEPVTLSVDASSHGLGACLLQNGQPVVYASRSLNKAERNYAQLEKEMLAIVFGATKFHQYVYGKTVDVESDHKPLESLFKKPLSQAPQRIQRMMLKVQQYDLHVKYTPGTTLYIADTLSRAPLNRTTDCYRDEFEVHVIAPISENRSSQFQLETDKDRVLSKVKNAVVNGWPDTRAELDPDITDYWNFRDELCICDGLLLKGDRIVTPPRLRTELLNKLHESHLGIEKCLDRARETVFWPGLSTQLKELVEKCQTCNRHRNKQQKEPLLQPEIPNRPWQILSSDLFVLNNDKYLVLADYYSKYFEVTKLPDSKSSTVINCLKQHFARFGIAETLKTDNGPEFSSYEFKVFADSYNIKHITSSPLYPQSNGFAERTVQTAKKLLKKAFESNNDPYLSLLELRNTPIKGIGKSPVELLMGRRTRTAIPTRSSLLNPSYDNISVKEKLETKQKTQKLYFDKASRPLSTLQAGDVVHMRNENIWDPAQIVKLTTKPRSYIVERNGKCYRRNRRDLIQTQESPPVDYNLDPTIDLEIIPSESSVSNPPKISKATEVPRISRVSGRVIKAPSRFEV